MLLRDVGSEVSAESWSEAAATSAKRTQISGKRPRGWNPAAKTEALTSRRRRSEMDSTNTKSASDSLRPEDRKGLQGPPKEWRSLFQHLLVVVVSATVASGATWMIQGGWFTWVAIFLAFVSGILGISNPEALMHATGLLLSRKR